MRVSVGSPHLVALRGVRRRQRREEVRVRYARVHRREAGGGVVPRRKKEQRRLSVNEKARQFQIEDVSLHCGSF